MRGRLPDEPHPSMFTKAAIGVAAVADGGGGTDARANAVDQALPRT